MPLAKVHLKLLPRCALLCRAATISTSAPLAKNRAGKYRATIDRTQMLTYEMAQKPHHIGVRKAWLSWHSQNLEEFRQTQPYQVAQDEIIRRFVRGFFPQNIAISGNELVIKRRGNAVYVAGFFQHSRRLDIRKIYWMFGFTEEFLSLLLKQPVKLEMQFTPDYHHRHFSVTGEMTVGNGRPLLVRRGKATSYKTPAFEEREEGYDGRLEWSLTDHNLLLIAAFRNAVLGNDFNKVKAQVQLLSPEYTNESQLDLLCNKICDRSSAEPLKEALLTAITIGSRPLVEFILSLFHEYPGEERSGCYDSPSFMPHMTPLMMACICNNFGIVECLLMRNHDIDLPHRADCVCDMCYKTANLVSANIRRLDTYRALSSEAFLWLSTSDPMLAAIQLSRDLQTCESTETQHKDIYQKLQRNVQNFATSLVQHCWNMEEVDVLLQQPDGSSISDAHLPYPRVRLALDGEMRQLTANLSVQMGIENKWHGEWRDYGKNTVRDAGRMLCHTLLFPILAYIHALSAGRLIQSFNYPVARFASYTASYFSFLAAIITLRIVTAVTTTQHERTVLSNNYQFFLQCYIFIYMFGMIVWEFLEFSRRGIERYYEMWWRWFDLMMLGLFFCAMMTWIATWYTVAIDGLPTLRRWHWIEYDVHLLFDIFYGGACIMAFWRVFYFVQLYRFVGSTVISIGKCVSKIYYYFIIMIVVLASFAIGVNMILEPYSRNRQFLIDGLPDETEKSPDKFMDLVQSSRFLFWSFFGYLSPDDYKPIVGHVGPDFERTRHRITRNSAEIAMSMYHIVMIITLLNLMVSLLVKTADEVLDNEDVEWKYTKVHIYYEFFEPGSSVPPPFNLIFMLSSFMYQVFSKDYTFVWPDMLVKREATSDTEAYREMRCAYRDLIVRLFQRYRASKELHFKTIQTMDSDKEKKNAVVKVAFMNSVLNRSAVSDIINPTAALSKDTVHSRVCSSCNERIVDSQSTTCKTCCQAPVQ
ncbi:hypothetical protein QR680_007230 [Steinernema hermaphroditum]|uniref:Transient receptor ion channel domain-containing protein n=1 Tax=Steinernema hermaphroditum TaxID=289476 RepID=A0AA39I0I5_9BILA|nr:hypothetical protein QR680_007230 [Steinernema hermaphroditum]